MTDETKQRLAPLPKERWDDDVREALHIGFPSAAARFLETGPDAVFVPNVLTTMMHHPALTGPFLVFNRKLLERPVIGHRLREIMVLRVAWRTQSAYEWAQHTHMAADLGITQEQIEAIARPDDVSSWTPLEAELLAATDQLLARHCIDDSTWARLADEFDERQLVEITFIVGTYTCLAMAFNSFGLQLDPGLEPLVPLPPAA